VGSCDPEDPASCVPAPPDDEEAEQVEEGPPLACRLVLADDELGSACQSAGTGELDTPCLSTSDCGAGLACVGGGLVGRCRPYCCRSDACDGMDRTYCSPQPERDSGAEPGSEPLIVPVCVSADDCDLGEPYPCPSGRTCECGDEKACMVVRAERDGDPTSGLGMTACVAPGDGEAGDACPCSWGHVCSRASGTCLELCSTVAASATCSERCQASAELPLGWGVCIRP
jgi:hypothetical protein